MSEHSLNYVRPMSRANGKKDAILEAALKVFARRGYHSARTQEIALEAGVAEGTLYNYFSSREEIFLCLFDDRWEKFTERVRRHVTTLSDPSDKLKAIFSSAMRLFLRNKPLAQLFLMETAPGSHYLDSRVALRLADFLDLIEEIIEEGKRVGKYHPDLDSRVARMVIYGSVQGILFSWVLKEGGPPELRRRFRFSMVRAARTLRLVLKSGLGAPAAVRGR